MENTMISFLEHLSKNFTSLNEKQKKHISEFYIQFQCEEKRNTTEYSEKDLLKFLSLGWFIYENQIENNTAT
jgi:hypothetical protein